MTLRFAIDSPISGDYSDPRLLGRLALLAEQSGWDGFFIWDHLSSPGDSSPDEPLPVVDPWVALAVMAVKTHKIRIGTAVTPIPRRRPWKLARETVSLDRLSDGRLTLGVGLGEPAGSEYERFGEDSAPLIRAAKLDEGLEVLTGLWSGQPFSHRGERFSVQDARFLPTPVQSPRIPIWVGGQWPNRAPLRRAARWDGVYPIYLVDGAPAMTPAILNTIVEYVGEHRKSHDPFDVVAPGAHLGHDRPRLSDAAASYAEAGATWYAAPIGPELGTVAEVKAWIAAGPPGA